MKHLEKNPINQITKKISSQKVCVSMDEGNENIDEEVNNWIKSEIQLDDIKANVIKKQKTEQQKV